MPMSCDEPYYCSQQIDIPSDLPDIMKQFTKAAIRTQPKDVLGWATAYFMALYKGEEPPVKERYEMPKATQKTDSGLTIGLLKVLNRQLRDKDKVTADIIEEKWKALDLPKEQFDELLKIGDLHGSFEWEKFLALAASALAENIQIAITNLCGIVTDDLEGGPSRIPIERFEFFYTYLAALDEEIQPDYVSDVLKHYKSVASHHDGYIQPSFFQVTESPSLYPKK